ncbi:hypothetical protein V1290_001195 [Bradyrhizobium sp. AZCC 1578]
MAGPQGKHLAPSSGKECFSVTATYAEPLGISAVKSMKLITSDDK